MELKEIKKELENLINEKQLEKTEILEKEKELRFWHSSNRKISLYLDRFFINGELSSLKEFRDKIHGN